MPFHRHEHKILLLLGFGPTNACAFASLTALWKEVMRSQDLSTRWFDEEQLLVKKDFTWPGIKNTFEPPVVQLPKYFSVVGCNFGLSTYVSPYTRSYYGQVIGGWGSIDTQAQRLLADLERTGHGGEAYVKSPLQHQPILVLWLWADATSFEMRLNDYTNDPFDSPQFPLTSNTTNSTGVVQSRFTAAQNESSLLSMQSLPDVKKLWASRGTFTS